MANYPQYRSQGRGSGHPRAARKGGNLESEVGLGAATTPGLDRLGSDGHRTKHSQWTCPVPNLTPKDVATWAAHQRYSEVVTGLLRTLPLTVSIAPRVPMLIFGYRCPTQRLSCPSCSCHRCSTGTWSVLQSSAFERIARRIWIRASARETRRGRRRIGLHSPHLRTRCWPLKQCSILRRNLLSTLMTRLWVRRRCGCRLAVIAPAVRDLLNLALSMSFGIANASPNSGHAPNTMKLYILSNFSMSSAVECDRLCSEL